MQVPKVEFVGSHFTTKCKIGKVTGMQSKSSNDFKKSIEPSLITLQVAVKIVSKKSAPKDYLTKFLPREIQCMHKLRHKHVVRMLEVEFLIKSVLFSEFCIIKPNTIPP